MIWRKMPVALVMICLAAMWAWPEDKKAEPFRWQGTVAAGKMVEVKGVNGPVKAQAASGAQVELEAIRSGNRSDPSKVEIKKIEHAGGVTFCAVYPSEDPSRPNECTPGEGGKMSVRNNDVKVEFAVRVPAGVKFVGRTVNGGVEASELSGDVEAYTVNGGIQIATRGWAQGKTVNGGISASLGNMNLSRPAEFSTVNGGVSVSFQSGVNANLEAETVNGNIHTDFPLTVQGKFGPKKIQGTLGSGGPTLRLATVNGSIQLQKNP
jgi:hypothetical protein